MPDPSDVVDVVGPAVDRLRGAYASRDAIRAVFELPARPLRTAPLPEGMDPVAARYLGDRGISLPYVHQAQVAAHALAGRDVIVTTATASGKTLAFTLPILDAMARDPEATALFLYPMKALTNDQLQVLEAAERATGLEIAPAVYDGDTPRVKRPRIRQMSRAILTNPYEIHETLPYHHLWRRVFANLRFVVIDEAHRYTGVFGSHVAQVIRRMLRIAQAYGSEPRFLLASASIANPGDHASRLTSRDCVVVQDDGSPAGPRTVVFLDAAAPGGGSPLVQTRDVFAQLVRCGLRTLCFTQSRKAAEVVASLAMEGRDPLPVAPYRAGYLPQERRRLERALFDGTLRGVVSTPALELGIDVGDLDAVVVSGYPGSISAFWQQAGRAGRRGAPSLAVFVGHDAIVDQFVIRTPALLMDRGFERATIDLDNEHILAGHMLCAAAELPVVIPEGRQPDQGIAGGLAGQGLLRDTDHGYIYAGVTRPQQAVKLDRIGDVQIALIDADDGTLLETLDLDRALREAFPGAVYLHGARTWTVEALDLQVGEARLRRRDVDFYTQALVDKVAEVTDTAATRELQDGRAALGGIRLTHRVTKYLVKRFGRTVGGAPLDLPERTFTTRAMWLDVPAGFRPGVTDLLGSLHALEHALVGIAPLALSCDASDLAGFAILMARHSGAPALFVYDGYEGGIGLADRAFAELPRLLTMAREVLTTCRCESGCLACCLSARCGSDNQPMDKTGAAVLAAALCGGG